MQKTLKSRKFVALLLALMMALAILPMSAMAASPGDYLQGNAIPPNSANANCSTYVEATTAAATEIDVTFVIEAGDMFSLDEFAPTSGTAFRLEIPVTLSSAAAKSFTVGDVIDVVNARVDLEFLGTIDSEGNRYINAVTYNGNTWEAGQWGMDGWVMRVNDQFPVKAFTDETLGDGYMGTAVGPTHIKDGDVIHFFYDYPSQMDPSGENIAAKYVRGVYASSTATSLTVQLQSHNTFIDQSTTDYLMYIYNYVNLGSGIEAKLYNAAGTLVGTATSDANGQVTFNGSFSAGQTYTLKTTSQRYFDDPDWGDYIDGAYFVYTGAYNYITVA